jgi:glyoxylase-like metal-dependent hydrolase (beta-lactamase superfamily II)
MATTPEQVAPGVYRVDAVGYSNAISVFLLANDDGWALVDTGVKGSAKRIRDALISLKAKPDELRRIYLTHHHPDHIGGLPGVREWAPDAGVVASEHEGQVISGRRAPDEPSSALFRSIAKRLPFPTSPVDHVAREGEGFAGFRVICTPGHSLGHTSLLRDEDGVLLTGDAFGCLTRKIRVGVRKFLCADPAGAKSSAEKLLTEEFTTVAFSHGKTLRQGARERLREVTARNRWA